MITNADIIHTPVMKDVEIVTVSLTVEGADAIEKIKKAAEVWIDVLIDAQRTKDATNECWCDPETEGVNPCCPTHGDNPRAITKDVI